MQNVGLDYRQIWKATVKRYLWNNWRNFNVGWVLYDIKELMLISSETITWFFKKSPYLLEIYMSAYMWNYIIARLCFKMFPQKF